MKNIVINIPDMQSTHCQTRVNNAVKALEGVQVDKVEAGKLSVSLNSEELKSEVVKTIEKAGYTVEGEDKKDSKEESGSSCSTGCCK